MRIIVLWLMLFLTLNAWCVDQDSLKKTFLDSFKSENYALAIQQVRAYIEQFPKDHEGYYYLAFFLHYQGNDSKPLAGYDLKYSTEIFTSLKKALELNPDYGNARYLYGVECQANAFKNYDNYDLKQIRKFFKDANDIGAYPPWYKELGKMYLDSCEKNAILFMGGNSDYDICEYLHIMENYRPDITIIPVGLLDRPWYVKVLKQGVKQILPQVNLDMDLNNIMDMHPYKWKTVKQEIPLTPEIRKHYELADSTKFVIEVYPDLFSQKETNKLEDEAKEKRTYLSPGKAVMLDIIRSNFCTRPIYFSRAIHPATILNFATNLQFCGLIQKLMPVEVKGTKLEIDYASINKLLKFPNLKDYKTILKTDLPRVSVMTNQYYDLFYFSANYYLQKKELRNLDELIELYKKEICIGRDLTEENSMLAELEKLVQAGQKK